jgi:transcriptional regulator GlxA family with amidase domain
MTHFDYIPPMTKKSIFFIVYPGFELLDLSGPVSVFTAANTLAKQTLYEIRIPSTQGGLITSSSGLAVQTQDLAGVSCDSTTTMLVVGADKEPLQKAMSDLSLCEWLKRQCGFAERYGSVCSGTFLLNAAGLLDGKTVTTHWAGCQILQKIRSEETVLKEALYHVDGKCWTSAGVTTGIDMALEMLKRDHGHALMQSVAQYLVVYTQRPGKQSQFAVVQEMVPNAEDNFSGLISWLKKEVMRPIKVAEMADLMCMSERSFQRRFSASFTTSPSRFFERMRMEYARDFLLPRHSVELAARMLGYSSIASFRKSFHKHFGLSPSTSKQMR